MAEKCSRITPGGRCSKPPKVNREGRWYCTIHDPEYVSPKRKKWRLAWNRRWALREQARAKATEGLTLEELQRITPELIRNALANKGEET